MTIVDEPVLDPRPYRKPAVLTLARRPSMEALRGGPVLFFDNTKLAFCNYAAVFERLRERLAAVGVTHIVEHCETVRGRTTHQLNELATRLAQGEPVAAVVALGDEGRMLLVRQYRHALGDWTVEIPAGRLEGGESIEGAARRELEEETGFEAAHWEPLRSIVPAAGFSSEVIHIFLATQLRAIPGGGAPADDDEEIEVTWSTPAEILGGENGDAKTLIGAALVLERLG